MYNITTMTLTLSAVCHLIMMNILTNQQSTSYLVIQQYLVFIIVTLADCIMLHRFSFSVFINVIVNASLCGHSITVLR